jgi:phytanoyl-CoA hydroxylase
MITASDPRRLYPATAAVELLPSPAALDEAHVAAYHRDGFLAMENLLSLEEVATAKTALDDLIHDRVPGFDGLQPEPEMKERWADMSVDERAGAVRKVWLFAAHEPCMGALTRHPMLHRVLERLIGEPCRMIQDMALLKPPHIGSEKPWHQDMAYFGWSPPERIVGVWIALDPATAENGCMQVIPGTHRAGPVPHVHARDCQIPDERVAADRAVLVPLPPGGALFFTSLLHHGTPPNRTPHRRWAVQFHYVGESVRAIDRLQHAALYFEGDMYAGCRSGTGRPISELTG